MLKKLWWSIILGVAHAIPAKVYKDQALDYIRFKRGDKKTERAEKPKEQPDISRFLDHGPSSRRKPN